MNSTSANPPPGWQPNTYLSINTTPNPNYPNAYVNPGLNNQQYRRPVEYDPMDGMAVATTDKWYLFEAGRSNCRSVFEIYSTDMFKAINVHTTTLKIDVTRAPVEGLRNGQLYLWNPQYNCLVPIEKIAVSVDPTQPKTVTFAFCTMWNFINPSPPEQCNWYRHYELDKPADDRRVMPLETRSFKLPWDGTLPEVPEFENGDQVYDWIESQLD